MELAFFVDSFDFSKENPIRGFDSHHTQINDLLSRESNRPSETKNHWEHPVSAGVLLTETAESDPEAHWIFFPRVEMLRYDIDGSRQ
jgi:hypothetical protein